MGDDVNELGGRGGAGVGSGPSFVIGYVSTRLYVADAFSEGASFGSFFSELETLMRKHDVKRVQALWREVRR